MLCSEQDLVSLTVAKAKYAVFCGSCCFEYILHTESIYTAMRSDTYISNLSDFFQKRQ